MKPAYQFIALFFALSLQQAVAQSTKVAIPETNKQVIVTFAKPGSHDTFQSLTIVVDRKRFSFLPKNPVIRIPSDVQAKREKGVWTDIPGLKLDSSRFFLRGEYVTASRPHTLLFFLGEAGIDAAPIFVIGFDDDGEPFKVLERSVLDVTSLQSVPDGALIVGKTSLSEVMGGDGANGSKTPYATTYDPFSVFVVHLASPAIYSLEASRDYNQKHYVWAGPHTREDYSVLYNMPGHIKPFGTPASKVSGLLASAGVK